MLNERMYYIYFTNIIDTTRHNNHTINKMRPI